MTRICCQKGMSSESQNRTATRSGQLVLNLAPRDTETSAMVAQPTPVASRKAQDVFRCLASSSGNLPTTSSDQSFTAASREGACQLSRMPFPETGKSSHNQLVQAERQATRANVA